MKVQKRDNPQTFPYLARDKADPDCLVLVGQYSAIVIQAKTPVLYPGEGWLWTKETCEEHLAMFERLPSGTTFELIQE